MYASKSTKGFYDPVIHGNNIPPDAVEISMDQYVSLMESQYQGKVIYFDNNGYPFSSEPTPIVITFNQALSLLNTEYQKDVDGYNKTFATVYLADGPSQEVKQQAIREQYYIRKSRYTAEYTALRTQYGV